MKDTKITAAWDGISLSDEGRNRILNNIHAKQSQPTRKKNIFRSAAVFAAAAAALCVVLIANSLFSPADSGLNNMFTLQAFAFEQQDDGTLTRREISLLDQAESWVGYMDGERFFASVGLRYEGENIRTVEFAASKGFFATQHIDVNARRYDTESSNFVVAASGGVMLYSTNFDIVGSHLVMEENTVDENLHFFWGTETTERNFIPETVGISVLVTFNDGETLEYSFIVSFEDRWGITVMTPCEYETAEQNRLWEHFMSLSPDELELVSIATATPAYHYTFGEYNAYLFCFGERTIQGHDGETFTIPRETLMVKDWMLFDVNGLFRSGFITEETGVYITIFHLCEDGNITGKLYRAPHYQ